MVPWQRHVPWYCVVVLKKTDGGTSCRSEGLAPVPVPVPVPVPGLPAAAHAQTDDRSEAADCGCEAETLRHLLDTHPDTPGRGHRTSLSKGFPGSYLFGKYRATTSGSSAFRSSSCQDVVLPVFLTGESLGLEEAAESPLCLLLGGEDFHLGVCGVFVLRSALVGHGSEVKSMDVKSERSCSCGATSVLVAGAWGGCGSQVHWSLRIRGSGFIILQMRSVVLSPSLSSMAAVLRITLKCVFSEGVMVTIAGSD
ncbi:hypothetical protein EYF80_023971 [Liparis tanakae]|uniref:Uncharacterized protein n=1 Tax=Liparis tanakae TaxID=230148 RepID=A0A4Z2HIT0_9TELE|nr:hypothetical protein EYF80_023971 [Liparis tanakae]